jgi:hypothetical protein
VSKQVDGRISSLFVVNKDLWIQVNPTDPAAPMPDDKISEINKANADFDQVFALALMAFSKGSRITITTGNDIVPAQRASIARIRVQDD